MVMAKLSELLQVSIWRIPINLNSSSDIIPYLSVDVNDARAAEKACHFFLVKHLNVLKAVTQSMLQRNVVIECNKRNPIEKQILGLPTMDSELMNYKPAPIVRSMLYLRTIDALSIPGFMLTF